MNEVTSGRSLFTSMMVAVLIAGVILVTAVLPAEYGIDPTGIGARLGVHGMSAIAEAAADDDLAAIDASAPISTPPVAAPVSELDAVWKRDAPYRSDQLSVTLALNEGAEIKALMLTGERLMFTWVAEGGVVNFDMHGEKTGAKSDEFTSYWKGRATQGGHGAFTAPFDGTHGWYWRNRGTQPVTVIVKTSGYYEKLYRP